MGDDRLKLINAGRNQGGKVLLVSMPWADAEVPSIQIAVLKKFLQSHGIPAEAGYWNLEVALALGFETYTAFSHPEASSAECLYSYLHFPEMRKSLLSHELVLKRAKSIQRNVKGRKTEIRFRWNRGFFREFEALHQSILDRYDWRDYSLVGFTLNYGQTVASLYMAREIKKRNPHCRIIFGGAEASRELGASLIEHFPEVDFACNGEGELPLLHLSKALMRGASLEEIRSIRGIIYRDDSEGVVVNAPHQVERMDELPTPDYDEYFECLERRGLAAQSVVEEIPIEASRGCPFSCNFCGLNLQWENFRSRSPERVAESIRELSSRYKVFAFRFMDNILPKNSQEIFERIAELESDFRFFYEIRAQTPPKVLRLMKKAGASRIQCGIEAFSTPLLKKFNKNSRFIHNLQVMKICEELGIESENNLIINFPLSTKEEVEETLRNIEFCTAYQPVHPVPYRLQVGSPDYDRRSDLGVRRIRNDDVYRYIYPPKLFKNLNLIAKSFLDSKGRSMWKRIPPAVRRWKKEYEKSMKGLKQGRKHLLTYFDVGTFLQIEDYRGQSGSACKLHVLDDLQRQIYLYAEEIRPWNKMRERFLHVEEEELQRLLRYFIEKRLMFEEDGYYLSLAMSADPEKRLYREEAGTARERAFVREGVSA